jgi:hypothetical protein
MGVGKSTFAFTNTAITLDGGSTTINITRDNQSYSHKLSHGYGTIATLAVGTTSYTWEPTADQLTKFFAEISNQKTRQIDVYLDTYNGSTLVGRDVHALTVTLSEATGKPTLSSFVINDSNATTKSWGILVNGKSVPTASQTATAKYGASIVKTVYTYGGNEYSSITDLIGSLPLTTTPTNYTIGCKTVDSRGFVTTVSLTKSCAKYEAPTIDTLEMVRCDSSGNETEAGTKAKAIAKGSWASLGGKNTATFKIGYKLQNGDSYTYQTIAVTNGTVDVEQVLSVTLAADSDYLFAVSLVDGLNGFTEDGIGFSNSKNVMYVSADGNELVLGSSSDGNILIGTDHVDIRKSEDVLVSFSGETRTETSEFTGDPYNKNYGKLSANNIIISSGARKESDEEYEVAEISQYTGVDPALTGKGASMNLETQIGKTVENEFNTYRAAIRMGASYNGRNEIFSSITEEAEEITLKCKDIYIKPTSNFNYDIPVRLSEDCDLLTFSGKYYLGNGCINRPVNQNGWLECKQYSTDYCHQTYTTYDGEIYKRTMKAGVWGKWTQDSGLNGVMYDLGGVKMLHSTWVTKPNDTSVQLFTISQLKTRFGISSASSVASNQFMVIVQNGDGNATAAHMEGSTWVGDKCYAVFSSTVSAQIRINYLVIYTPSEYFGRYSV